MSPNKTKPLTLRVVGVVIGVLGSVPEDDVVPLDPVGIDTGSEEGPMFVSLDPDIDVGSVALGSVPEDDVVASIEVDVQVPGMEAIALAAWHLLSSRFYKAGAQASRDRL